MFNEYKDILSVNDLCKALNICKSIAYKLLRENQIKYKRIGNIYKIPKKYLIEYIESLTTSTKRDTFNMNNERYSISERGAIV